MEIQENSRKPGINIGLNPPALFSNAQIFVRLQDFQSKSVLGGKLKGKEEQNIERANSNAIARLRVLKGIVDSLSCGRSPKRWRNWRNCSFIVYPLVLTMLIYGGMLGGKE